MREALLALPFGLAVGMLLGLVGGGGSILAVPVLVYVLGEPVRRATTESLLIVGVTALVGTLAAARDRRVDWPVGLPFGAVGAIAAVGGTALNRVAGSRPLLIAFGLLLLAAAAAMVRGRPAPEPGDTRVARPVGRPRATAGGAATGLLTGFLGVGGGFLIVPILTLALGLPMGVAVGTSLLVIALTSGAALLAHLASGDVNATIAVALAGSAVVGAVIGTSLHGRLRASSLQRVFAVLLVAVAAFVLGDAAV